MPQLTTLHPFLQRLSSCNAALHPSASNPPTLSPVKHYALQSPASISSSLNAKLPQDPTIDFGSPERRPAFASPPSSSSSAAHPPSTAKSSGFVTACAQRQCWACYLTSAIASIICFCAAAIILLSFATSSHVANAKASEESARAADSPPQCHHFNGPHQSNGLSAFLQLPHAALLLFASSVFLAAVSRSSFNACLPLHQPTFPHFIATFVFTFLPHCTVAGGVLSRLQALSSNMRSRSGSTCCTPCSHRPPPR